jgi:hypothetical protein
LRDVTLTVGTRVSFTIKPSKRKPGKFEVDTLRMLDEAA